MGSTSTAPSSTPPHGFVPPQHIEGFRLKQKLGFGNMGAAYLYENDAGIQRTIKFVRDPEPELLQRLKREAKILRRLKHRHIARFRKALISGPVPWVMLDYINGVALTDYCDTHRIAIHQRLELFAQLCRGVEYLHDEGVLHRDIKPSNILVTTTSGQPRVKVIDFGLAKAPTFNLGVLTEPGTLLGTPHYMSPEQLRGERASEQSDVFALGMVLFELITGVRPNLWAENLFDLRKAHERMPPPSAMVMVKRLRVERAQLRQSLPRALARELRQGLDHVCATALRPKLRDRYGTVNDLRHAVQRCLGEELETGLLARTRTIALRAAGIL